MQVRTLVSGASDDIAMNKSAHPESNLLVYLCGHLLIDFDQRAFSEQ